MGCDNRSWKRSEVLRRFPTLELLDSEAIAKITFDAPGPSTAPAPSPGDGPTSFPVQMAPGLIAPGMESFVAEFLTKFVSRRQVLLCLVDVHVRFFTALDTSRASLVDVYGPSATFSFSANTSIPPRARIQGYHSSAAMPNQRKLEWPPYIEGSRNLSRVATVIRAEQSLHTGAGDIVTKLISLPGTRHDIATQEKFVVDAWPVRGVLPAPEDASTVLFITVHGEFEEGKLLLIRAVVVLTCPIEPSRGIRSFDRSFILAPAEDGSRAKLAGWPVVILSDQLVVRAYSSHEAWAPGPIRMPPQETARPPVQPTSIVSQPTIISPPIANDPALAALPEQQWAYVVELSARTGLNAAFSVQCLEGNAWDPQKALANFEQVKVRPSLCRPRKTAFIPFP